MSVYKVIEIIGTSNSSREDAARDAVMVAGHNLRVPRVAEVVKQDVDISHQEVDISDTGEFTFRTKLSVSFTYERDDEK